MRPFADLTYRGQIPRLRGLAAGALAQYGLAGAQIGLLAHRGDTLFRVDAPGRGRWLLRVYGPDHPDPVAIRSELLWLDALARETDLGVPTPVLSTSGTLLTMATAPGVPAPRLCTLLGWVVGRSIDAGLTPVHLARVGRLMAGLHQHAAGFRPLPGFRRPRPDWAAVFDAPVFAAGGSLTTPDRAVFAAAAARVRAELLLLDHGPAAFGLIHADLQQTNYLFQGGVARAIDFGDCCWSYFLFDMAIPLFEVARRPTGAALRAAFLDGYATVRALPARAEAGIRLFTAVRLAKRVRYLAGAPDPALRGQAAAWGTYAVSWLESWLADG